MRKLLLVSMVLGLVMLLILPTVVMAASVTPTHYDGNPTAADVGYAGYYWYKEDSSSSGTYNQDGYTVTWTVSPNGRNLDFSDASPGIVAVIVKGSNGANVYRYNPGVVGDTDLEAPHPHDISHIIFIWEAGVTDPVPELPAGILFGMGLAGTGAFFFIKQRRKAAVAK